MRKAAWFQVAAGAWLASLGCLPEQELSAYSAGAQASGAPALEPVLAPGASPGEVPPAASAPSQEQDVSSLEPVDTPPETDGPAPPEQLAPIAPAPSQSSAPEDEPVEDAERPPEPAPADPAPTPVVEPQPEPASVPVVAEPAPALTQFRFVRLVADSEFNGGPLSSAAELDVLDADGQPLDRTGWVATADSAEPTFVGGAPASLAIDGLRGSVWHTAWFQLAEPPPHPHFLQVDLGQPRSVTGFRYVARQDASVGRVADYRFFVSVDGVEWGEPILAGRLQDTAQPQDVRVSAP